LYLSPS